MTNKSQNIGSNSNWNTQVFIENNIANEHKSQSTEVETIMDLICYITENAILLDNESPNIMPDPEKKLERFSDCCSQIMGELTRSTMYATAHREADRAIGLDKIRVMKKVAYLKQISIRYLRENNNNPVQALDKLTDYFETTLRESKKHFDHSAIRYYLISEIPKCNVFPNEIE